LVRTRERTPSEIFKYFLVANKVNNCVIPSTHNPYSHLMHYTLVDEKSSPSFSLLLHLSFQALCSVGFPRIQCHDSTAPGHDGRDTLHALRPTIALAPDFKTSHHHLQLPPQHHPGGFDHHRLVLRGVFSPLLQGSQHARVPHPQHHSLHDALLPTQLPHIVAPPKKAGGNCGMQHPLVDPLRDSIVPMPFRALLQGAKDV
jgi:hypothetical protein